MLNNNLNIIFETKCQIFYISVDVCYRNILILVTSKEKREKEI